MNLVAAGGVVAAGFLVGRTIGDNEGTKAGSIPTRVATQQASAKIPTLGEAEQIPAIDVTETTSPPTETAAEESSFTPTAEPESAEPNPESSSAPEVTVAPDG